jgi:hypothetical protein
MKAGFGTTGVAALLLLWSAARVRGSELDPKAAFERLKGLNGEWQGHAMTEDGPAISVSYAVTGAGSVVMERLFPGTPHVISMYYLDGKDLVMTHYCASGNQPHLRLNPGASSAGELSFDFTGGTNLNAAVDSHMHSGRMMFKDDSHIENVWVGYEGGKPVGSKRFILTRMPKS